MSFRKNPRLFFCMILGATAVVVSLPTFAGAFNASSTSFFLRQTILSGVGGSQSSAFSTSTSYKSYGAMGQTGNGTSTSASFGIRAGFISNASVSPAPVYDLTHYHWRNDDGSESSATSGTSGTQDTATSSVGVGFTKRLRVEIANHGGTLMSYAAQQFGLQYAIQSGSCSATPSSAWNNIGKAGDTAFDWTTVDTTNLTNGANTTNIAQSTGGVYDSNHTFLAPNLGVVENTATTTGAISVPSDTFAELEFAIAATSRVSTATYCFRVANASSTSNFTYSVYPQATAVGQTSLTFTIDSNSETFPALTPGILVATSSILNVMTTNASGFNITVARNNPSGTLTLNTDSAVSIPDKTAWAPGGTCGTAGNGTGSSTSLTSLQFRVYKATTDTSNYCSAWWGSADTSAAALFAGFPSSGQKIVDRPTSSSPATQTTVLYNLDVSATQKTGVYSGSITYTVTANP